MEMRKIENLCNMKTYFFPVLLCNERLLFISTNILLNCLFSLIAWYCACLGVCVEGGSIWAVQVEGMAAAAGLSIVISTSALDESLGVVGVWEQATWVTVAFAVTWVYKEECTSEFIIV